MVLNTKTTKNRTTLYLPVIYMDQNVSSVIDHTKPNTTTTLLSVTKQISKSTFFVLKQSRTNHVFLASNT